MKANYKADYLVESDKVDKNYSKDNAVNYLVIKKNYKKEIIRSYKYNSSKVMFEKLVNSAMIKGKYLK